MVQILINVLAVTGVTVLVILALYLLIVLGYMIIFIKRNDIFALMTSIIGLVLNFGYYMKD